MADDGWRMADAPAASALHARYARIGSWVASLRLALLLVAALLTLAGCQAQKMETPHLELATGDFGAARVKLRKDMTDDRTDRRYLLDRMRVGALTLADGYPQSARRIFEQTYELLRTRGINDDKTVDAVVLHEGVKIWKGEPFEQALAMVYYGMAHAEMNSWDNARAAADNALFKLRDFGSEDGERLDTHEIARKSLLYERARKRGATEEEAKKAADYLDHGYVVRDSNFTLGYMLAGLSNQQLGRDREASDYFNRVVELDPDLESLVETLRAGDYNTLLVVGYGLGPRKQGYGPDNALARFNPRFPSNDSALAVRVGQYDVRRYEQVLDVNRMAADHMWKSMEDIRIAKSYLGTGLLIGGAITTKIGLDSDNEVVALAGLGAMGLGLLTKSGAHADTRYCDVYPQRFYVVPLNLGDERPPIMLQVDGKPGSRLVLRGLGVPEGDTAQLRYVRLPHANSPPQWATSGVVHYGNARTGPTPGAQRPYILGGDDVRPPSNRVLNEYQAWGYLRDGTLSDLLDLYREERIRFTVEDQNGYAGRHVLEGGRSLVAPLPGTTGFARLFGQRHGQYQPRSDEVEAAQQRAAQVVPAQVAAGE